MTALLEYLNLDPSKIEVEGQGPSPTPSLVVFLEKTLLLSPLTKKF